MIAFVRDCMYLFWQWFFFSELQDSIETQYEEVYIQRQQDEMASGIFNEPLPPVRGTLAEIFHFRQGLLLLLLSMVSLMILIQFGIIIIFLMPMALLLVPIQIGIILMLNLIFDLIHDQTEESPLVAFYQSLVRVWATISGISYNSLTLLILEWNKPICNAILKSHRNM